MIYPSMNLGTGRGIADLSRQFQIRGARHVVLGLGGDGVECLCDIKRQVEKEVQKENGQILKIRFLAIDSDLNTFQQSWSEVLNDEEKLFIALNPALVANPHLIEEEIRRQGDWAARIYELPLPILMHPNGSGGIRQLGRLQMLLRVEEIYHRLWQCFLDVYHAFPPGEKICFHIISGLGGGTGSGIFLDIAYLIRNLVDQFGIRSDERIFGYFFLPDVYYESCERGIIPQPMMRMLDANSYAALKELDYWMHCRENEKVWSQRYSNVQVQNEQPPFDFCSLISGEISGTWAALPNAKQEAFRQVRTHLMTLLSDANPFFEVFTSPGANVIQNGKYYTIGSAEVTLPTDWILSLVGEAILKEETNILEKPSFEEKYERLLEQLHWSSNGMLRNLTIGAPSAGRYDGDYREFVGEGQEPPQRMRDYYGGKEQQLRAVLQTNQRRMLEQESPAFIPRNVENALWNAVQNGMFSVQEAYRALDDLRNQNGSLIKRLDVMCAETEAQITALKKSLPLREQQRREAWEEFQHSFVLVRRQKFEMYCDAVAAYMQDMHRKIVLEELLEMLQHLKKMLQKELLPKWRERVEVLRNMQDTFEENKCAAIAFDREVAHSMTEQNLFRLEEYEPVLNHFLAGIRRKSEIFRLYDSFINHSDSEISERELKRWVEEWLQQIAQPLIQQNFSQFITQIVPNATPQNVHDRITDHLQWMDYTARPRFANIPQEANPFQVAFLYGEDVTDVTLSTCMQSFALQNHVALARSMVLSRISLVRYGAGIPISSYRYLERCKDAYLQNREPGRHLYESAAMNWNDLPNPQ